MISKLEMAKLAESSLRVEAVRAARGTRERQDRWLELDSGRLTRLRFRAYSGHSHYRASLLTYLKLSRHLIFLLLASGRCVHAIALVSPRGESQITP